MSRSIFAMSLTSKAKKVLGASGLYFARDLEGLEPVSLSQMVRLPLEECSAILSVVRGENRSGAGSDTPATAYRLLHKECLSLRIKTSSNQVDALFCPNRGGIPVGRIVEFYGEAGSGKTQFCLQICANAIVHKTDDGNVNHALFIDTENSMVTKRFLEIALASTTAEAKNDDQKENANEPRASGHSSPQPLLDCLRVVKCDNPQKLQALVLYKLEEFLDENPEVRVVVLDSIAFQFRYGYENDYKERTAILLSMARKLMDIAINRSVAVVITNHITCDIENDKVIPALGKTWSHCCSTRILLEKANGFSQHRKASVVKSLTQARRVAYYQITAGGIRDVDVETGGHPQRPQPQSKMDLTEAKNVS